MEVFMHSQQTGSFQGAIDVIESLPDYHQEDLLNIIQKRLTERKRETLAQNIQEARKEHNRGEIKKGTVEDVMKAVIE